MRLLIIGRKAEGFREKFFGGTPILNNMIKILKELGVEITELQLPYKGGREGEDLISICKRNPKIEKYDAVFFTQLGYAPFFRGNKKCYFLPQIDYFHRHYTREDMKVLMGCLENVIVGTRVQWGKYLGLELKTHYLPYYIDVPEISLEKENKVLWVGRDDYYKGYKRAEEIQKSLVKRNIPLKFTYILEDGDTISKNIERKEGSCEVVEKKNSSREEVMKEMSESKIMLFTSESEYIPITLHECAMLGCLPIYVMYDRRENRWHEEWLPFIQVLPYDRDVVDYILNVIEKYPTYLPEIKAIERHYHIINDRKYIKNMWRVWLNNLFRNEYRYIHFDGKGLCF